MFGFDGDIHGFRTILRKIANNKDEKIVLTHKEVRAYARCLLKILPSINEPEKNKPVISTMLATMSISGIPHYDRAFLAEQILELIKFEDKREETQDNICF